MAKRKKRPKGTLIWARTSASARSMAKRMRRKGFVVSVRKRARAAKEGGETFRYNLYFRKKKK